MRERPDGTKYVEYIDDGSLSLKAEQHAIFEERLGATQMPQMRSPMRSPLMRRKDVGDSCKAENVDVDGYWVHVQSDRQGTPRECAIIEVKEECTKFCYIDKDSNEAGDDKLIERLPRSGVFVFLW